MPKKRAERTRADSTKCRAGSRAGRLRLPRGQVSTQASQPMHSPLRRLAASGFRPTGHRRAQALQPGMQFSAFRWSSEQGGPQQGTAFFGLLVLLRRRQGLFFGSLHHTAAFPSASATAPIRPSEVRVAPETVSIPSVDWADRILSSTGRDCV